MTRESECVVVSIWANMPAPWFTICRKKKSIPQGLRSPAANAARLYLFSLGETELVSFILCYLLISYSGTQSGGLACARQQGRKTIHHGDSKDKHIYTCIHLGFFSPGPTRASPFFSLPSTFLRLSLHFISVICCTYIKWVVFYNNWFFPPPHLIENNVHSDWWMHLLLCNGVCNKRRIDPQRCSAAVYSIQSTIQQRGGQYRRASSIIFVLHYVQPVS